MSKSSQPAERRQFGRRNTYLLAWLSVPGRPRLPCTVLDISASGALIGIQRPAWLPYNFMLTIEATKLSYWCEVRHERADAMGVRFLSAVEADALAARSPRFNQSRSDCDSWAGQTR